MQWQITTGPVVSGPINYDELTLHDWFVQLFAPDGTEIYHKPADDNTVLVNTVPVTITPTGAGGLYTVSADLVAIGEYKLSIAVTDLFNETLWFNGPVLPPVDDPDAPTEDTLHGYASLNNLAAYLCVDVSTLSADMPRMLTRASELITEKVLKPSQWWFDNEKAAVVQATCAQVEYWTVAGQDMEFSTEIKRQTSSKITIEYYDQAPKLAPRARRFLFSAGLLYRGVGQRHCCFREDWPI